jgi:O-succinylhomoserine sulfhydrylase
MTKKTWHNDTLSVRGGLNRTGHMETAEAMFLNSGFVYPSAEEAALAFEGDIDRFLYSRFGNPTATMLQERLALMEGAEACLATGTGMAAMFSGVASMLSQGDRIVASRALFGACYSVIDEILPRWGIERQFVDGTSLDQWEEALSRPARMVFLESPSNPMLDLVDIRAVAELAHRAGALVVVDNVFGTQTGQKPLELGADMVMYSITKHHDGHGRVLGGALLGSEELIRGDLLKFYRQTGPAISAFNAWVVLKSLETLALRVDRMAANASLVAEALADHPEVDWLRYPYHPSHPQYELARRQMSHGGTIVSFNLKGGKKSAWQVLDALELIDISNNLGDAKSLACHPATTTHSSVAEEDRLAMGIGDGLIRLSVGLEHADDLIADLCGALDTLRHG